MIQVTSMYVRALFAGVVPRFAAITAAVLLTACGGSEPEPRITIAQTFFYTRLLPAAERKPTGIETLKAELVKTGHHPENAACAIWVNYTESAVVRPYPLEAQVISFTIPASEWQRASAMGYYPPQEFATFYDLKNPLPCHDD